MGEERIHPLSKPQAIAALGCLLVLLLGGVWGQDDTSLVVLVMLYLPVTAAILLILMVTPNQVEYVKGLWRALKAGRSQLSWWDDLALNRTFLLIACGIVLVTPTVASSMLERDPNRAFDPRGPQSGLPLAIATGVLVVAYVGLAYQYCTIRFGRRGMTYFALFLFLAWLVPLVAGTVMAMASMRGDIGVPGAVLFGMTPISGIGMVAAGTGEESLQIASQGSAITPALLFTFVFNSLLISARRRVDNAFQIIAAKNQMKNADSGSLEIQHEAVP